MLAIINGVIVTEQQFLKNHIVLVEDYLINAIVHEADIDLHGIEVLDAKGGYVSPGFVDIHSDYIETIVSPRPTSVMSMNIGLRESERILMTHGITTIFHSLSYYGDDKYSHKAIRNPENVQKCVDAIYASHEEPHLIRHRLHARFEIDSIDQIPNLERNIKDGKVHLLSFMDHTPGQGQYRNLEIYKNIMRGYRSMSDQEANVLIQNQVDKAKMTFDDIERLSRLAIEHNIAVASHDDDDVAKLQLVQSYGTTISEFPITLDVAKEAKKMGMQTIAGAPNILNGGSHSGNLSASEAIQAQVIDIICSDYYPPAMLHGIFELSKQYDEDLHRLFQLVTINPARAVNLDHEIGSIEVGKKADILIIEQMEDGYPVVTTTMVDGNIIMQTNYR
ncbi:phosphonate metabolism protein PhnM [Lysinibacillus sphaericus]|uniref:Alpha-D-ribose 1-methylphosphonate 5-triphosphate diphosphatase n=1 Tax=Lysinibacillus sphaericus TaxID=1421 RepID=A0A2S0JZT3_LYSSH|nr:phosphonate metabolism protein PhnM [Lysinibacillus sphaericus]AVK96606.1 alpha-D-ribose 1-methylphosphonate 5-triphosphate diphosphatase [Lysinibacillus sphaericus]MED4542863.1 phosphonate metabolism protein PhnM [Lysinibacillus sphaericus]TKI19848.1 phosphonate metabolism protein PhnM [Lysinibacillus sphaericus]SUV17595.1 amidohydrolase [Lysinibacillus sphaericus]GEC83466.1 alpha-D-ribose 1-methylphosphonate 5-triphosphate diphosphatase [Lysinibacillus sphaericus]